MNLRRLIASPEARDTDIVAVRMRVVKRCPMSALGHKQTFALQKVMSALPPKADMCGATMDVRFGPKADNTYLFDHLVGSGDERGRHGETKRLRSLEIDDQLQLGREFHRQITRFGSFQDFVHIGGGAMKVLSEIDAIADETARIDMIPEPVDGGHSDCLCD